MLGLSVEDCLVQLPAFDSYQPFHPAVSVFPVTVCFCVFQAGGLEKGKVTQTWNTQ